MVKLHNIFLGSVSVLAVTALVGPALAQSAGDSSTVETVVVTGIRGSLKSAQSIKQNSDVIVDSITAEDIGALPDRSVVESIQRIPGVAINKFLASNDPDHFSAEGSGVVVRGLTSVRSEFNGRDTFSANNGRELGFADVPSEMLVGVDLLKSPSADMIEGGIAGTVNLKTRVPFDSEGRLIAGTLEGSWGDFRHRITPTISGLYSNRWSSSVGEFGLLGDYIYSQTDTRSDNAQADYFVCRTDLGVTSATCPNGTSSASGSSGSPGAWFPSGANIARQDFVRKRVGYSAAGQWQSNDGTWLATLQFLASDTHETSDEKRIEIASDVVNQSGGPGPLPAGGSTFDFGNDGVFTNGVITGQTGWRSDGNYDWYNNNCSDSPCDPRTPYWGLQSNNHARNTNGRYLTADYGANLKWNPNDTWAFNLDLQHVESATHYLDTEINGSTYQAVSMDLRGDLPKIQFLPPEAPSAALAPFGMDECLPGGGPGIAPRPQPNHGATYNPATTCNTFMGYGHTGFDDPYNTFWRSAMDHYEHSNGIEDAMKFDVDYKLDDGGWLNLIRVGARWSERDETTRSTLYNWGVLSEQWGNGGPVWLSDPVDGIPNGSGGTLGTPVGGGAPVTQFEAFGFNNFFNGGIKNPVPTPYLFSNIDGSKHYKDYAAFATSIIHEWQPGALSGASGASGWVPWAQRSGACQNGISGGLEVPGCENGFLPGEVSPSIEKTESAYMMLKFGHPTWDGQSIDGNIGVRYVHSDHETIGSLQFPSDNLPTATPGPNSCLPPAPPPPPAVPPPFTPPLFCTTLTPAQQAAAHAFSTGTFVVERAANSYDNVLPSFNLRYKFADDMQARFAVSESISRPPMGETRYSYLISVLPNTATSPPQWGGFGTGNQNGNPYLKPTRADNFDLTYEWYPADTTAITVAAFYKELHGVITQSVVGTPITNPTSGITEDVTVTTPINSPKAGKVKGLEFAYRQTFDFLPDPFNGFGVDTNFTYIDSHGVPQNIYNLSPSGAAQSPNPAVDLTKLPLEQLSRYNFNLTGYYEKGDISARLAYTWRSRFLLTAYDVIVPHSPIMNDASGQLDGSFFYTLNDHFKVGVEGQNLLNTVTQTEQVLDNTTAGKTLLAPRAWYMSDRRVTMTLRVNF